MLSRGLESHLTKSTVSCIAAEEGLTGLLRPYHRHGGAKVKTTDDKLWNNVSGNIGGPYGTDKLMEQYRFTTEELECIDSEVYLTRAL